MTTVFNRPINSYTFKKSSNQKGGSAKEHLAVLIYILNIIRSQHLDFAIQLNRNAIKIGSESYPAQCSKIDGHKNR